MGEVSSQTLHIVARELTSELNEARAALETFGEQQDNLALLRKCGEHLHSVHGALRVAEVYGAALLAEEMGQVLRYLIDNFAERRHLAEGLDALMRAMVQLPTYLERVLSGGRDMALILLPLLNDLRAVRGHALLSEGTLLLLNLSSDQQANPVPAASGEAALTVAQWARKLRPRYQLGLLGWIKGERVDQNLEVLARAAEKLEQVATTQAAFQLWWVVGAVLEGLREGGLEGSASVKRLLGHADREMRRLYEQGEARYAESPPLELMNNLLYYVARTRTSGPRVAAVRASFRLDELLPVDDQVEQARESLSAPSVKLMKTVAAAIKEDLGRVKDALDIFVRQGGTRIEELMPQLDLLKKIGDTLGVLGLGELRDKVGVETADLQRMIAPEDGQREPLNEGALLRMAATLIKVEDSLDEQLVGMIVPSAAEAGQEPGAAEKEDVEFRQVAEAVLRECIVNLARIKEAVALSVEKPREAPGADQIPQLVRGIIAGLVMLGKTRAAEITEGIERALADFLRADDLTLPPDAIDRLADAIVAVEYYMETIQAGRADPWYMLDNAETCLRYLANAPRVPRVPGDLEGADSAHTLVIGPLSETVAAPTEYEKTAVLDPASHMAQQVRASAPPVAGPPEAKPPEPQPAMAAADREIDPEFLELFIEEAKDEIAKLQEFFPQWDENPQNADALINIRRSFHTLKGSGRMVGAQRIGEFAWAIENMLNRVINKTLDRTPDMMVVMREAVAAVPELVEQLETGRAPQLDIERIIAGADALAGARAPAAAPSSGKAAPGARAPVASAPPPAPAPPARPAPVLQPGGQPSAGEKKTVEVMDPALHEIYSKETVGHLATIREFIAAAPPTPPYPVTEALHRSCHTLSGTAKTAGARQGIKIAEPLNRYIRKLYDNSIGLPAEGLEVLKDAAEAIQQVVEHINEDTGFFVGHGAIVERLEGLERALDDELARLAEAVEASAVSPPVIIEPDATQDPTDDADVIELDMVDFSELGLDASANQESPAGAADAAPDEAAQPPQAADEGDTVQHLALGPEAIGPEAPTAPEEPGEAVILEAPEEESFEEGEAIVLEASPAHDARAEDDSAAPAAGIEVEETPFEALDTTGEEAATVEVPALDDMLPPLIDEGTTAQGPAPSEPRVEEPTVTTPAVASTSTPGMVAAAEPGVDPGAEFGQASAMAAAAEPGEPGGAEHAAPAAARPASAADTPEPEPPVSGLPAVEPTAAAPPPAAATPPPVLAPEPEVLEDDEAFDPEVAEIFTEEATELLETADNALSAWMRDRSNSALMFELKRALHTLKGGARMAGIRAMGDLSHELETFMQMMEAGMMPAEAPVFDALQASLDELHRMRDTVSQGGRCAPARALIARIRALAGQETAEEPSPESTAAASAGASPAPQADTPAAPSAPPPVLQQVEPPPAPVLSVEPVEPVEPEQPSAPTLQPQPHAHSTPVLAADPEPGQGAPTLVPEPEQALEPAPQSEADEVVLSSDDAMSATHVVPVLTEAAVDLDDAAQMLEQAYALEDAADASAVEASAAEEPSLEAPPAEEPAADASWVREGAIEEVPVAAPVAEAPPAAGHDEASSEPAGIELELAADELGTPASHEPARIEEAPHPAVMAPTLDVAALPPELPPDTPPQEPAVGTESAEPALAALPPGRDRQGQERQEFARVDAALLDTLLNNAGEVSIFRARLEQQVSSIEFNLAELGRTVTRLKEQLRKFELETEAQILHRHQDEQPSRSDFDPLELDRYSMIQQLSRAFAESVSDVASIEGLLENLTREAQNLLLQQSRVVTELQNGLMRTRMVPFQRHVQRLSRLVRQVASETGKRCELVVTGASGELDRQVLERMLPPFEHMLRNSVVHGIETPEERRARGKPETGTIKVGLHREGSEMVIVLEDDGRGIDVQAVRARAQARGLLQPGRELTDEEALQLILEPGFSTASSVTHHAGRGVGMDVVVTEIKKLGGALYTASQPGQGVKFTIRLPFTLAITQALIVRTGDELYALPLPSVEGVARVTRSQVQKHLAEETPTFSYGGQVYRFQHLGAFIGGPPSVLPDTEVSVPVVLIRAGEHSTALVTDELVGSREMVVKSVGPQIAGIRGIAGATILGDGRIVIILDMGALVRSEWRTRSLVAQGPEEDQRTFALVVDDSITVRRVTQRLLERHGMRVMTAKDGVDALSILQEHQPDIILLDIEMPRMDGYELAGHVRSDPRLADIPIVMITSRVGEKHRARAIELGVNDYLGKPYQENQLLDAIEPLVQARRKLA